MEKHMVNYSRIETHDPSAAPKLFFSSINFVFSFKSSIKVTKLKFIIFLWPSTEHGAEELHDTYSSFTTDSFILIQNKYVIYLFLWSEQKPHKIKNASYEPRFS